MIAVKIRLTSDGCVLGVAVCIFCTGNYVFVASRNRQFCKKKQRNSHKKRLIKCCAWEVWGGGGKGGGR